MDNTPAPHARLRLMQESDLVMVLGWRNHPDIRRHMYSQAEISMAEHENWFRTSMQSGQRTLLILEVGGHPRGFVSFRHMSGTEAIWGFYLAPDAPKGTGKILGQTATQYAFDILKLDKIWGEVLPANQASQRFHLHQGFVLHAILLETFAGSGTHANVHKYLLTRQAWQAHPGETK